MAAKLGQAHLLGAVENVARFAGIKMHFVANSQQELARATDVFVVRA